MKTNKKPFARHNLTITIIGNAVEALLLMQILETHRHDDTVDVRLVARAAEYFIANPTTSVNHLDEPHKILAGPALPLFDMSTPAVYDTPEGFVVHYGAKSEELPIGPLRTILSAHPRLRIALGHSKRLADGRYSPVETAYLFNEDSTPEAVWSATED